MLKFKLFRLLLPCFLVLGCSQQPDEKQLQSGHSDIDAILSDEVAETSGLACLPDGSFLTINDSGNAATVYQLDTAGRIINRIVTDSENQDWEALAVHQGQLWIGDIGNNSGQRATIELYHAPMPAAVAKTLNAKALTLRYAEAPMTTPSHFQHGLDAEALVSTGEQLLVFSKNWIGLQSKVYAVDTSKAATQLTQIGETSALPGLITDAAFSAKHQMFVVTGYGNFRLNPLSFIFNGDFAPFLAVLDAKFQLVKVVPIANSGQLEALCIDENHNIWLSQEKSARQPAKLWRWGPLDSLMKSTD